MKESTLRKIVYTLGFVGLILSFTIVSLPIAIPMMLLGYWLDKHYELGIVEDALGSDEDDEDDVDETDEHDEDAVDEIDRCPECGAVVQ